MRKSVIATVLIAAVAVSGCGLVKSRTNRADEFAIARTAPLIVPPNFNLAPPVAGTAGISAGDAQQQAIDTLFGGPAPRSPGEMSMLDAAGRDAAQLGIRSTVWDPDTRVVDKGAATLQIINAPPKNSSIASAQVGR